MTMSAGWYLRRLSRMGPREVGGRAGDAVRRRRWRSARPHCPSVTGARFTAVLPAGTTAAIPPDAAKRLITEADRLMYGHAEFFGVVRDDLTDPDWWSDPKTGRRAPWGYAFDVPYRNEDAVGDIKQIWELSRHQYLTVLAAAYAITGDERYAERVAEHLRSWWTANPPLRGVHWISGIELGIRLLSWVWIRRLLDGWPGAAGLFEDNPVAQNQIWHHQRWLAAFPSRGSSANNHAIAEAAGQFAAACAFGWFPSSARWRTDALRSLERHLRSNTFTSGLNRELATEYHGLVLELGLAAVAEADATGVPVPASVRLVLLRMTDALAAIVDSRLRPPRQGDADDGHGLVVDGPGTDRWASLLATGDAVFGRLDWWPAVTGTDVRTPLLAALIRPYPNHGAAPAVSRPATRPAHFADAGMTILRGPEEIWCRCDGVRTASCPSPRMPTRTHCPWRSGTTVSTCSPTRGRSAITDSPSGGSTSGRPSATTPCSWTAVTSPSPAARSCGPGTPAAVSWPRTPPTPPEREWSAGVPSTTATSAPYTVAGSN